MTVGPYKTWLFDCDGVLLDSNAVKTDAFFELALPFGKDVADALVAHHRLHGGVSRFKKVRYLYEDLLGRSGAEEEIMVGISKYGRIVKKRLLDCDLTTGLRNFIESIPENTYRAVVSGGLEEEVRFVLQERGLGDYFDAIYGSPGTKEMAFDKIGKRQLLGPDAVYIGDSRYDYEVSMRFGMDFVFVHGFTEFAEWAKFFVNKKVKVIHSLEGIEVS